MKEPYFYSCKDDSDCIATKAGCCGCTSGGAAAAINKILEKEWQDKLSEECREVFCPAVISNHPSCFQKPMCVNNKCVLG